MRHNVEAKRSLTWAMSEPPTLADLHELVDWLGLHGVDETDTVTILAQDDQREGYYLRCTVTQDELAAQQGDAGGAL